MGLIRHGHRRPGKRNRNSGPKFHSLTMLGTNQQRKKWIVVHFCSANAIIALGFNALNVLRNLLPILG
jgi:hypothetical protein